jgi:hypothetical protein
MCYIAKLLLSGIPGKEKEGEKGQRQRGRGRRLDKARRVKKIAKRKGKGLEQRISAKIPASPLLSSALNDVVKGAGGERRRGWEEEIPGERQGDATGRG